MSDLFWGGGEAILNGLPSSFNRVASERWLRLRNVRRVSDVLAGRLNYTSRASGMPLNMQI